MDDVVGALRRSGLDLLLIVFEGCATSPSPLFIHSAWWTNDDGKYGVVGEIAYEEGGVAK